MKNTLKKTVIAALTLLTAVTLLTPYTQAASKSSQIEASYKKLMNIEASLVTYNEQTDAYSHEQFYAGYSVDSKGSQIIYYHENMESEAKAELKKRKISTNGIKLLPVKYAYYQLHSVALSMENIIKRDGSNLGFTPVFGVSAEENKVVAYIPGLNAEKKDALLKLFGLGTEDGLLIFKDSSECLERSNKLLALLPQAVRASDKYRGSYIGSNAAGAPHVVVLLTDPHDPSLRKLIDPFIIVKKPEDATGEYYDPFQTISDPTKKHALVALYDSISAYGMKTALFQTKGEIPISQWYYDEASGKIIVGIPGLNAKLTKQFQTIFGKSELVELRDMDYITAKPD